MFDKLNFSYLLFQQRGRAKEEEFLKKLQEMMVEEEKQRIPIAQGLPWTTDEPEVRPFIFNEQTQQSASRTGFAKLMRHCFAMQFMLC